MWSEAVIKFVMNANLFSSVAYMLMQKKINNIWKEMPINVSFEYECARILFMWI